MTHPEVIDLRDKARDRRKLRGDGAPPSGGPARPSARPVGIIPDRTDAPGAKPALRLEDSERTRCEVWTRVMGYHRPVSAFNAGKRAEHGERQYFTECAVEPADRIERVA